MKVTPNVWMHLSGWICAKSQRLSVPCLPSARPTFIASTKTKLKSTARPAEHTRMTHLERSGRLVGCVCMCAARAACFTGNSESQTEHAPRAVEVTKPASPQLARSVHLIKQHRRMRRLLYRCLRHILCQYAGWIYALGGSSTKRQ